eukprot:GHVH01001785.1.p1 GENE.GHVH01001785.1~~GHVH01001785.1.p1  ORF type:complete len:173 (+),score=13.47 GHVH01001785.1:411-929(+)
MACHLIPTNPQGSDLVADEGSVDLEVAHQCRSLIQKVLRSKITLNLEQINRSVTLEGTHLTPNQLRNVLRTLELDELIVLTGLDCWFDHGFRKFLIPSIRGILAKTERCSDIEDSILSIPCLVCPVYDRCVTSKGIHPFGVEHSLASDVISPETCKYIDLWLQRDVRENDGI